MEERQEQFNNLCRNRAAFVMFNVGAAIAPMSTIEGLTQNEHHFCELMHKREEIITDMYVFRNAIWDIAHTEKGYEKYTEEFIHGFGNEILEKAELFFHYLRGLNDAKKGSVKPKSKKNKKAKSVRGRRDSATTQGTSVRSDDVGQHVDSSGNSSTDVARG
jgi:hypothetical protein